MKKLFVIVLVSMLAVYACRPNETKQKTTTTQKPLDSVIQKCYLNVTREDSLIIKLAIVNDRVTGIYNWLPAEKDKMRGTLEGTIENNMITALYNYDSEGMNATEEKILKIEGDKIYMKSGELEEKNGVWVLKNKDTVAFIEAGQLVDCEH